MCTKDVVFCMKTTTCNNLLFHSCKKRCDLLIHDFLFQALHCCTIFTPLPFDDIYLIYLLCIINYLNMTTNEFIVERYYNRHTYTLKSGINWKILSKNNTRLFCFFLFCKTIPRNKQEFVVFFGILCRYITNLTWQKFCL